MPKTVYLVEEVCLVFLVAREASDLNNEDRPNKLDKPDDINKRDFTMKFAPI